MKKSADYIKTVDFQDALFKKLLFLYYINSFPYGEKNALKSIRSRKHEAENLISYLEECNLSLFVKDKQNTPLVYTFFIKEKDGINLKFVFPNHSIQMGTKEMIIPFYQMLLEAFEFFKTNEIYGAIERIHKKNNYANWLKRYLAVKYVESNGEGYDKVYFNKDKVLKHYEQLQAASNRDESGDQKS